MTPENSGVFKSVKSAVSLSTMDTMSKYPAQQSETSSYRKSMTSENSEVPKSDSSVVQPSIIKTLSKSLAQQSETLTHRKSMASKNSGVNTVPKSVSSAVSQFTMETSRVTATLSSVTGYNGPELSTGVAQVNSAAISKYNLLISCLVTMSVSILFIF